MSGAKRASAAEIAARDAEAEKKWIDQVAGDKLGRSIIKRTTLAFGSTPFKCDGKSLESISELLEANLELELMCETGCLPPASQMARLEVAIESRAIELRAEWFKRSESVGMPC